MPLPQKYRKPVNDFFAGKITAKEMREMIERIDNVQMSFEFKILNGNCPHKGDMNERNYRTSQNMIGRIERKRALCNRDNDCIRFSNY